METIFLVIAVGFALAILWLNKSRNAWDILFFNSTVGILILFMIGLLLDDKDAWLRIISFIGTVATGSAVVSAWLKKG